MNKKNILLVAGLIALSAGSVWAMDDAKKINNERLEILHAAYKADNLATVDPVATDIKLLEDHIVVLNAEKDQLNRFMSHYAIPGLYTTGAFATSGLFLASLAVVGVMGLIAKTEGIDYFLEAAREGAQDVWTGSRVYKRYDFLYGMDVYRKQDFSASRRLMDFATLNAPFIALASGIGTKKIIESLYQYNKKRNDRLKAIEKSIALDQAIITKLKEIKQELAGSFNG